MSTSNKYISEGPFDFYRSIISRTLDILGFTKHLPQTCLLIRLQWFLVQILLLLTFCEIGLSLDFFYTRSIKGSGSRESPDKNEVKRTKTVSHGHVTCKRQCWQSLVIPYWSSHEMFDKFKKRWSTPNPAVTVADSCIMVICHRLDY